MNSPIKSIQPLGFPWATQDPFLFCVHHLDYYPRGNEGMGPNASLAGRSIGQDFDPDQPWRMYHGQQVPGFPAHPHYGFETVTAVTTGVIDHSDSLGAAGRFGFGDVQWMTAGRGVQHCEMFPLLDRERNNPLELFQIWLNLPRAKKSAEPYFAMLWNETIPVFRYAEEGQGVTEVRVIAGQINQEQAPAPAPDSWAADPDHEVAIWIIHMEANAQWVLPAADKSVNRSLYFYDGESMIIAEQSFTAHKAVELQADKESTLQNGPTKSSLLLLQGKPINEPVVQYGPFVVNEQHEIQEVMNNYQRNQFGGWPWTTPEHVHSREKGRFALYPDGKEELRPL